MDVIDSLNAALQQIEQDASTEIGRHARPYNTQESKLERKGAELYVSWRNMLGSGAGRVILL